MKREGNLIERIAERDNLLLAFWKAARGRRASREVVAFQRGLDARVASMAAQILAGDIPVGKFTSFPIRDPKPRQIFAPAFAERVLHHAIMNVCEPRLDRYLIADTYACRRGKGTSAALDKAQQLVRRYRFVLKLDIAGYFEHIDHVRLLAMIARLWKDRALLALLARIVGSHAVHPGKGLPIGTLTSQHFANLYLGALDHFCKQQLQCRGYVRYMDDFLLFADDRDVLRGWLLRLKRWLAEELQLELKVPIVAPTARGVAFLGFRVLPTRCMLTGQRKRRFARSLRTIAKAHASGAWSEEECAVRVGSVLAHAQRARSFGWRRAVVLSLGDLSS